MDPRAFKDKGILAWQFSDFASDFAPFKPPSPTESGQSHQTWYELLAPKQGHNQRETDTVLCRIR